MRRLNKIAKRMVKKAELDIQLKESCLEEMYDLFFEDGEDVSYQDNCDYQTQKGYDFTIYDELDYYVVVSLGYEIVNMSSGPLVYCDCYGVAYEEETGREKVIFDNSEREQLKQEQYNGAFNDYLRICKELRNKVVPNEDEIIKYIKKFFFPA